MSNLNWKHLLLAPALLGATLSVSAAASASEPVANDVSTDSLKQVSVYGAEGRSLNAVDQVTSVSQLTDVRPTDWAFQALQSLVERYGCIVGYPDRTYRGNQSLSRYEFAAGLNACMDRINELIAAATADLVKKEDLATLQKLQEEFAAELATLRGRVDALEARTATLEKQQFSTTTKLNAEVIFNVAGAFGDDRAVASPGRPNTANDVQDNIIFSDRVRLNFDTSFTGKDRLRTRLEARNTTPFGNAVTGTNMTRLSYDGDEGNAVNIGKLFYRFPVGDNANIVVDAIGGEFYDNVYTFNPLLEASGRGSISRFGRFSPIYRGGAGGAGATLNYNFGKAITLSAGYLADQPNNPVPDQGLFSGSNAFLAQIGFRPTTNLDLGFTYVRSYDRGGNVGVTSATGSGFANQPFGGGVATSADNFGVQANFRFSPKIAVGGWVGYTEARTKTQGGVPDAGTSIWNWAVTLAFPDLGKKGNLAGIIFGMPPKTTDNSNIYRGVNRIDNDTSFHLEGLYRFQVTNNISVTPGVIVLFNPEHNDNNDTVYVGVVRTTFTF